MNPYQPPREEAQDTVSQARDINAKLKVAIADQKSAERILMAVLVLQIITVPAILSSMIFQVGFELVGTAALIDIVLLGVAMIAELTFHYRVKQLRKKQHQVLKSMTPEERHIYLMAYIFCG